MAGPNKLFIGPFPSFLTKEEKREFLQHFGAVQVNHICRKNKERFIIAIFSSHKDCQYALQKIHQIELFGVRISARYCNSSSQNITSVKEDCGVKSVESSNASFKLKKGLQSYEAQLCAISSTFGINYPISPKLRYSYPRASASVLCNIAHALVAVPKFYTQVLHLMNKMNLPCPFGPLTAEPSMCREARAMSGVFGTGGEKEAPNEAGEEDALNPVLSSESETESELESDEEFKSLLNKKNLEPKRILKRKSKQMKRPRLETLKQSLLIESSSKPSKENAASVQEVFEVPSVNPKKKFNVHVQNTPGLGAGATTAQEVASEGFGKLYPQVKEGKTSQPKESSQFITQEELSKNRIPESEWPIIPVFKNYSPGTPSNRLYIKNLSKTATGFDLRHIFGKYLPPESDDEATKSNIRVMKEGRMKGQAFVTFPSTEAASLALKHTNGYILKDKPIVIVFGKVKAAD